MLLKLVSFLPHILYLNTVVIQLVFNAFHLKLSYRSSSFIPNSQQQRIVIERVITIAQEVDTTCDQDYRVKGQELKCMSNSLLNLSSIKIFLFDINNPTNVRLYIVPKGIHCVKEIITWKRNFAVWFCIIQFKKTRFIPICRELCLFGVGVGEFVIINEFYTSCSDKSLVWVQSMVWILSFSGYPVCDHDSFALKANNYINKFNI